MSQTVRAGIMDKAAPNRPKLKDFAAERSTNVISIDTQLVTIDFQDNEATRRLVMHSAKRVIKQHRDEIQELAYK
jgi:hypothetical protein